MSVDLSKSILHTGYNSFKNDGNVYTGSITFPTFLAPGATVTITKSFQLSSQPQFTKFFAFFLEAGDAIGSLGVGAQWYHANVAASSVAYHISAPAAQVGYTSAGIFPIINGTTLTVEGIITNPYGVTITVDTLTVPFAFVEYSLTN